MLRVPAHLDRVYEPLQFQSMGMIPEVDPCRSQRRLTESYWRGRLVGWERFFDAHYFVFHAIPEETDVGDWRKVWEVMDEEDEDEREQSRQYFFGSDGPSSSYRRSAPFSSRHRCLQLALWIAQSSRSSTSREKSNDCDCDNHVTAVILICHVTLHDCSVTLFVTRLDLQIRSRDPTPLQSRISFHDQLFESTRNTRYGLDLESQTQESS